MTDAKKTDAPILAVTMGDPAGVGPEIIAGAWPSFFPNGASGPAFALPKSRPVVFGDPQCVAAAAKLRGLDARAVPVDSPDDAARDYDRKFGPNAIPVLPCCGADAARVKYGAICAEGGEAAFRALSCAIDAALSGSVDAIVTAPLHKEALRLAGHNYPGHTEILAERCGVSDFGMALYLGPCPAIASPTGLGVVHVTLHESMRSAVERVSYESVLEKIGLLRRFMTAILGREPRLGVCALNCHASDGGLFGGEEREYIAPAVETARGQGADVRGPFPSDTLFLDAKNGLYDGIVAIYHDQGHIAIKLMDMFAAVNVSLGLPIIRTSVAHGTAFNIAGLGIAKTQSLIEAARVAALFALRGETP